MAKQEILTEGVLPARAQKHPTKHSLPVRHDGNRDVSWAAVQGASHSLPDGGLTDEGRVLPPQKDP